MGIVKKSLTWSDKWYSDSVDCCARSDYYISRDIDMSNAQKFIQSLKNAALKTEPKVTFTHFFVWAISRAIAKYPELNVMAKGYARIFPGGVNLGLSVAGDTFLAPVMVLKDAESKSIQQIAFEVFSRHAAVRQEEQQATKLLDRFGWIVPFGFLRRLVLRFLFKSYWFRQKTTGTFQISAVPNTDCVVPFLLNASGIFGIGQVRPKAVATESGVQIRPTVQITFAGDHRIYDGARSTKLLEELKRVIESDHLTN